MMIVILIVDGELMDVIEMMVDKQADLVVNLEADKVTKEKRKVDQEQDEPSTAQYCPVQPSTAQYSPVRPSTVQYSPA